VSGAWARRYDAITQEAAALLRAAVAIDTTEPEELAAALGIDLADVRERLTDVRGAGWTGPDGIADDGRIWLLHDAPVATDDPVLTARYLDHHLSHLDPAAHSGAELRAWADHHHHHVVAAVRAGVRTGHHTQVTALTRAALDTITDPDWHRALTEAAEPAAHDRHELLDLLRTSADAALASGALDIAEHQYGRAAATALELGDHDAAVGALTALVGVLTTRNQPPRAADALLELAELHRRAGDDHALATTLTELGTIMLTGNRPDLAATHLDQADTLLAQTGAPGTRRARVNELRGRALWSLGNTILARKAFRHAEELSPRDDVTTRDRLESLLELSRDATLPPDIR
jgi:tetratricopeptide (TPR) repeat protein